MSCDSLDEDVVIVDIADVWSSEMMTNIFSRQIVNLSNVEKIHINNFCDNVIKMRNKRIILLKKW